MNRRGFFAAVAAIPLALAQKEHEHFYLGAVERVEQKEFTISWEQDRVKPERGVVELFIDGVRVPGVDNVTHHKRPWPKMRGRAR